MHAKTVARLLGELRDLESEVLAEVPEELAKDQRYIDRLKKNTK